MNKHDKTAELARRLTELYPVMSCPLEYNQQPWRLLIMTMLAAQCTDARVNIVCAVLFEQYPNVEDLASASLKDVETIIRPCGLYVTKSRNIIATAQLLISQHNGIVPNDIEALLALPGVGRKTANLILSEIFGIPTIIADTHCMRLAVRMGLCDKKDPLLVERTLEKLVPTEYHLHFSSRMFRYAQQTCTSRSPKCTDCILVDLCEYKLDQIRCR